MRFNLLESISDLPKEILDFNDYMNKAEYNAPECYITIPVNEWSLTNAGCCWDFVSYESKWFREHKYKFKTFFVQVDNNNDCPTHTFLIFEYNDKYYWFESSWFKHQGIKEFDSYESAFQYVSNLLLSEYNPDNEFTVYKLEYDTRCVDDGNMTPLEYMETVYENGIDIDKKDYLF